MINTEKISNPRFRRALSHAIDRSKLVELIHGGERPTTSFVPGQSVASLSTSEGAACQLGDGDEVALRIDAEHCYHSPAGAGHDPDKARAELAAAKRDLGTRFRRRSS